MIINKTRRRVLVFYSFNDSKTCIEILQVSTTQRGVLRFYGFYNQELDCIGAQSFYDSRKIGGTSFFICNFGSVFERGSEMRENKLRSMLYF